MRIEEFRLKMESYRCFADSEARALKDPEAALEQLRSLYRRFDSVERQMADQVLVDWVLSTDEKLRFDGLALIDDFNVRAAIPALRKLAMRLTTCVIPSAVYDLKKIERVLSRLES